MTVLNDLQQVKDIQQNKIEVHTIKQLDITCKRRIKTGSRPAHVKTKILYDHCANNVHILFNLTLQNTDNHI